MREYSLKTKKAGNSTLVTFKRTVGREVFNLQSMHIPNWNQFRKDLLAGLDFTWKEVKQFFSEGELKLMAAELVPLLSSQIDVLYAELEKFKLEGEVTEPPSETEPASEPNLETQPEPEPETDDQSIDPKPISEMTDDELRAEIAKTRAAAAK